MDYLTILTTSVAVSFGIFYVWAKYKLSYWQRLGVPTLPTNILFGNFKDSIFLRISPGFLLGRLYKEANSDWPFFGVYMMQKPFLVLRDPKLIKQVLIRDAHIFQDRFFSSNNTNDLLGSRNLVSIKHPEWKYLRAKLSPTFTTGKIKQFFSLMVETSRFLNNFLENKFNNTGDTVQSFEVKELCTMYTTDIISSVAFGVSTNSFDIPAPEFYVRSRTPFVMTLKRTLQIFGIFFFPWLGRFYKHSFFGKDTDYFRHVFWSSMNAREESKTERGDMIDSLIKLKNEKQAADFKFEGDTLVAQSGIFFIAGLESSAVTMAFALYEMARHPEVQQRVRAEIHECLKDRELTYDTINSMKYLMQVINETMRFYPPAPIIDRMASQDYKIPDSNVTIPKGTIVHTPLPGVHMDPKNFRDPEKFDPDRFSDERKHEIQPCTFMPFGEGPRICIGLRVGMLQSATGIVRILNNYEISINPKHKTAICRRNVFTTPDVNGIHLYFRKLKS
nr:cytochrome P450 4AV17 [Meteorus pulchricornis]